MEPRRNSIPVIFARGTNYEVGYTVGRTFKSMIHEYLESSSELNKVLLPKYETAKGKEIYELTLNLVQHSYPEYLDELKGTAEGSDAPFYKLFLLHLDSMLSNNVEGGRHSSLPVGCSTVLCNHPEQVFIGHNEDAILAVLNHCYIIQADIEVIDGSQRKTVESFSSLSYAGHLPGFCMGYNKHGVIFSINVVEPKVNPVGKMPRHFVSRALLKARNLSEMKDILSASGGPGIGDGLSVNIGFWSPENTTSKYLYNIEVGPDSAGNSSAMDTITINPGETILHCNRYQRLKIPDLSAGCWVSSERRDARYDLLPSPCDLHSVLAVLGDTEDQEFPFHRQGLPPDEILTALSGVFDFVKGTWSIYVENPKSGAPPVCVLPMLM